MSGTRPSGSTLGSRPAPHCPPLPPRQQWRRGRGHLASSTRAPWLLSIPWSSSGKHHRLMIPFSLCPPPRSPSRPTSRHKALTKAFISLRCMIPLLSLTRHTHGPERHPNHLSRLTPCILNTCRPSCRWVLTTTCLGSRDTWRARNHPPSGIGLGMPEMVVRLPDTVHDDPRHPPPRSTPRPMR